MSPTTETYGGCKVVVTFTRTTWGAIAEAIGTFLLAVVVGFTADLFARRFGEGQTRYPRQICRFIAVCLSLAFFAAAVFSIGVTGTTVFVNGIERAAAGFWAGLASSSFGLLVAVGSGVLVSPVVTNYLRGLGTDR